MRLSGIFLSACSILSLVNAQNFQNSSSTSNGPISAAAASSGQLQEDATTVPVTTVETAIDPISSEDGACTYSKLGGSFNNGKAWTAAYEIKVSPEDRSNLNSERIFEITWYFAFDDPLDAATFEFETNSDSAETTDLVANVQDGSFKVTFQFTVPFRDPEYCDSYFLGLFTVGDDDYYTIVVGGKEPPTIQASFNYQRITWECSQLLDFAENCVPPETSSSSELPSSSVVSSSSELSSSSDVSSSSEISSSSDISSSASPSSSDASSSFPESSSAPSSSDSSASSDSSDSLVSSSGFANSTTGGPLTLTSTKEAQSSTVITITSCDEDKCTQVPVTTGVTVTLVTKNDVVTSYTTYCPITTTETITSCEEEKCQPTGAPAQPSEAPEAVTTTCTEEKCQPTGSEAPAPAPAPGNPTAASASSDAPDSDSGSSVAPAPGEGSTGTDSQGEPTEAPTEAPASQSSAAPQSPAVTTYEGSGMMLAGNWAVSLFAAVFAFAL
ncbi:Histone-lysine N-methyltransferase [Wickerhamomyces ciferrii]|uniref:Histone-lysine N-methyltransferase n=1 Tax=Wickerhamomyces ciferrii (strain ATCC 14091 / BCRC 22168 / CBS 111 / JCM 3599 / NBRC 0793 / NRRL Y-1031 F-60-10) TaxID=1206466 RepID=K0KW93_WICCF|nr:Histone-lysine N-methyltransferase [Wickerhamomyces ciferrii]CCH45418.1 Histone-lysine N-methyltransferase [Wickerhamomyces ciferrii]